jgi:hypothetical protein
MSISEEEQTRRITLQYQIGILKLDTKTFLVSAGSDDKYNQLKNQI